MLINRSLDMYEKVNILGSMAGGDILSGREHGNSARTPILPLVETLSPASTGPPCPTENILI